MEILLCFDYYEALYQKFHCLISCSLYACVIAQVELIILSEYIIMNDKIFPCYLNIVLVFYSLMYGAEDPSIAGMVLDSPFSNLVDLMMELVDTYKVRLPKFTVSHKYIRGTAVYNWLCMQLCFL